MKALTKTSRTLGMIEKMFREINKDLFGGELPEPIFTIQSSPRAYGHMSVGRIWTRKTETAREINISAEYLDRPIEEICATLIHELCHLYAAVKGIQDTSRNGYYHNKEFKRIAEEHLIHIEHNDRIGWSVTKPTEALIDYIIDKGFEDIEIVRSKPLSAILPPPTKGTGNGAQIMPKIPKGSNSRKYICPHCKQSVRATKTVFLICGLCKCDMEEA